MATSATLCSLCKNHFREPFPLLAKLIPSELRVAWYYRLSFLWPLLARKWVRRGLRLLGWLILALYFAFVALVLVLRYEVLPEIDRYQGRIEEAISQALEQQVKIGRVEARWHGLNPVLMLEDVTLLDGEGIPALTLSRVQGELSWRSLWHSQPLFTLLAVERPVLNIRRNAEGNIFVAGMSMAGSGDPRALQWVLDQQRIQILDATLVWEDELRQAPPLVLEDLQLQLENRRGYHLFGLTGVPPAQLASRLDIRGKLRGRADIPFENWEGEVFTQLVYADLAAWKAWVDYPVDLPKGRGGVRLWAGREGGVWKGTADLVLKDLHIRLAEKLPELELDQLTGRLDVQQAPGYIRVHTRQLTLDTRSGIHLPPLDLALEWRGEMGQPGQGSFSANTFDLNTLAGLAAYLPLDATTRDLLAKYQPRGEVRNAVANWDARGGDWKKYSLKAGFENLGLSAYGVVPGAQGLVGQVEASERGGLLKIEAAKSSIELPAVFAESQIPLDQLLAQIAWKPQDKGVLVNIESLEFKGPHASGYVGGTYQKGEEGPGVIDLKGGISQAQATEVWRYIPKVVSADVPAWLRQGLKAGTGTDAKLVLKGDLKDFPFRDPSTGQFLITAKARDVTVHYAKGWPIIEHVEADMSFGLGMKIQVDSARLLGASLGPVTVEIPDFESYDERLLVKGRAVGPTAEFLKFIEQSPVARTIDNFTDGMTAKGNGRLELGLNIPLRDVDSTQIKGAYFLEGNEVVFVPGFPAATGVNGRLEFTENSVSVPDVRGSFLGSPMKMTAFSEGGSVIIKANGGFSAKELRHQLNQKALEHVTGSSTWQAEVKVRKKNADFLVTSNLQGLGSSLPAPFNKNAADVLPLRLQKSAADSRDGKVRDRIVFSLGKILEGELIRIQAPHGGAVALERGGIGIGQAPKLPSKGLAVFVNQDRLDLDTWNRVLGSAPGTDSGTAAQAPSPLNLVALQVRELSAFGHSFTEVGLRLRPEGSGWRAVVAAKEVAGELFWDGAGKGMVTADLKRLRLESPDDGSGTEQPADLLKTLPGMDIRVGDFAVGERRFGRLELNAENGKGRWNLRNIQIENPDGKLVGSGVWDMVNTRRTWLSFDLDSSNSGGMLSRLGYPGMVKGGTARLQGKLDWAGPPISLDPASLGGMLQLEAAKGQFAKLNPGAGRLLGLLSLQSFTRRLTLDFRDIFSDGFAYDQISAKMIIKNGVMRTDGDLRVDGPAGKVLMTGTVDMKQETQDLLVTVQPEVGGVAAVGAAVVINPVVGAAALVAQNVLRNPLNKMFSVQYRVTGSWDEPQMTKVDTRTPQESEVSQ